MTSAPDERPMIDENGVIHLFRDGFYWGACDRATYELYSGTTVEEAIRSGALRTKGEDD